jgi:hypothetical protein
MNKTLFAVLAVVVAAPAGAQEYRQAQARAAEEAYERLRTLAADQHGADHSKARSRTLEAALTAMNDGPEAGGRVMQLLQEKKIDVYFATQKEPVTRGVVNGRDAILLSDALPAHARVYAPLIAAEAAKRMYADMPDCAEREYMRGATAARVFAELGGDFKALPVVDGDRADAVKDAVSAWTSGAEAALEAASDGGKRPTIPDLQSKTSDPKAAAALEAANARYTAFLLDESGARREAATR